MVSHFDLNRYWASAKIHAIPDDITNDKNTSVKGIILYYWFILYNYVWIHEDPKFIALTKPPAPITILAERAVAPVA